MRIAVIGADAESVHTIEKAHELGHEVVTVDIDPDAPGAMLADTSLQCDISHEREVIDLLKKENIDLVCTTPIGRHLVTIGAVNDALGLPGVTRERAEICIDKYAFHARLRNVRLRTGHCYMIGEDHPVNAEDIAYPAVFKPRYGSHGRSVHYLQNSDELKKLWAEIWQQSKDKADDTDTPGAEEGSVKTKAGDIPADSLAADTGDDTADKDHNLAAARFRAVLKETMEKQRKKESGEDDPHEEYILEDAIPGTEYAVDGIVEGCNFNPVLIRRKTLTCPPSRQAVSYMTLIPGDNPRAEVQIREYMSKLCEVLGLTECMLHADVSIQGRTVNCIELSPSPAGRHVYDEFIPMTTGVDIAEQYLRYMAGGSHNFQPLFHKRMVLGYFGMENCFVHGIPSEKDVRDALPEGVKLRKWICNIRMLDYLARITDENSILSRGCYIIEGNNERELTRCIDIIRDLFALE